MNGEQEARTEARDATVVELLDQLSKRARALDHARAEIERVRAELTTEQQRFAELSGELAGAERESAQDRARADELERELGRAFDAREAIESSWAYRIVLVVRRILFPENSMRRRLYRRLRRR